MVFRGSGSNDGACSIRMVLPEALASPSATDSLLARRE